MSDNYTARIIREQAPNEQPMRNCALFIAHPQPIWEAVTGNHRSSVIVQEHVTRPAPSFSRSFSTIFITLQGSLTMSETKWVQFTFSTYTNHV